MSAFLRRWLRRITNESEPITIVSGLPRSGTSLMMKMLDAGGLPVLTDNLRGADADNPHGYYEFERVKQLEKGNTAWLDAAHGRAVKVISALLRHLPAEHSYRVIFMPRDLNEVLASQRKMMQRRQSPDSVIENPMDNDPYDGADEAELAALFQTHLQDIRLWLARQPKMKTLYVEHSVLLSDPDPQMQRILQFLELPLDARQMVDAIDPALYRNRLAHHK